MKSLLLSLVVGLLFSTFTPTANDVYICNGPKSFKYHLKDNCRGLKNCSTEIEKVSLDAAKKKGRTLCGYED
ncbi:hypothetical protein [Flavobacterium sp.]|uniref:hypothetical protein n=1 Tax=Flavobacterium sp. TaxID=239 RepID=UPI004034EB2B